MHELLSLLIGLLIGSALTYIYEVRRELATISYKEKIDTFKQINQHLTETYFAAVKFFLPEKLTAPQRDQARQTILSGLKNVKENWIFTPKKMIGIIANFNSLAIDILNNGKAEKEELDLLFNLHKEIVNLMRDELRVGKLDKNIFDIIGKEPRS